MNLDQAHVKAIECERLNGRPFDVVPVTYGNGESGYDVTPQLSALQAINIMKRVIEYLSCDAVTDEKSQQDALDIANAAIEELFAIANHTITK